MVGFVSKQILASVGLFVEKIAEYCSVVGRNKTVVESAAETVDLIACSVGRFAEFAEHFAENSGLDPKRLMDQLVDLHLLLEEAIEMHPQL